MLDAYSRDSVRGYEDLPEGFVLYYTNQKGNHQCAVKDDMQKIYPLFEACDAVILAYPLYFWSISGKLKSFIDRLCAVSKEDKYPKRSVALLMTAGDDEESTFQHAVQF